MFLLFPHLFWWRHLKKSMRFQNISRRTIAYRRSHTLRLLLNLRTLTLLWILSKSKKCSLSCKIKKSIRFRKSLTVVRANQSPASIWPLRALSISRSLFLWAMRQPESVSKMQACTLSALIMRSKQSNQILWLISYALKTKVLSSLPTMLLHPLIYRKSKNVSRVHFLIMLIKSLSLDSLSQNPTSKS